MQRKLYCARRPDLLDSALMRPGRLDRLLYVGVARDAASKASVLAALTRKCAPQPCFGAMQCPLECSSPSSMHWGYVLCGSSSKISCSGSHALVCS